MAYYPTFEQAKEILAGTDYKSIPVTLSLALNIKTLDIYKKLKHISKNVFILESCEDRENLGRYSFLGYDPTLEITAKDNQIKIKTAMSFETTDTAPHKYIRQILNEYKSPKLPELPPFTGGLVGYFSYDFIKYSTPKLEISAENDENFNDVDLMLFNKVIAVDNAENRLIFIMNIKTDELEKNYNKAVSEIKNMIAIMLSGELANEEKGELLSPIKPIFSKEKYCEMVEKAKKYIFEGDIFQVVLSNRFSADYKGSIIGVYEKLRKKNPSPYLFYFSSDAIEIAGASPETLVKVVDKKITTFPLAGTRKRGETPEEDARLEEDLLSDKKELAEHNMLVDLGRNDIGKVCKFGSVKVTDYMNILRFSTVMHIGSTVSGEVLDEKDALDAVDAVLPAGTLSGAPKIRAMEIIDELENEKRGIYGGAIGYLDFSGNVDTCIAIRLAFKKNDKIFVRSGAGIVMDSVPENEFEECINKANSIVSVLED